MDTVSSDSYRRDIWQRRSGSLLLLLAVWAVLPGEIWSQAREAGAVAFQGDGKIVAVASGGFAVARYHPDGSLDLSFGSDGKVVTQFGLADKIEHVFEAAGIVTLQSDDKIVAAGRVDLGFAVVRYNSDGSLDGSFGTGGKVITRLGTEEKIEDELHALALQTDGKIVVVGRSWQQYSNDIAVVRYNSDGSLDGGFGSEGKVMTNFPEPVPPDEGLPGPYFGNRSQDGPHASGPATSTGPTYGQYGYDDAFAVGIQADGKLVVGGTSLVRYNADGSLDFSFGSGGRVMTEVHALALQRDGKIVVVGAAGAFTLARYNIDGSLDASFGAGGTVTTQLGRVDAAGGVAIQADGKLVVVGTTFNGRSMDLAMVRYNPDGTLDHGFGSGGKVTSDFCAHQIEERYAEQIGTGSISGSWRVRLQADGRIVVAGTPSNSLCSGFSLFRYNSDGSPDATFGKNGRVLIAVPKGWHAEPVRNSFNDLRYREFRLVQKE